jgi:hypothetical protein
MVAMSKILPAAGAPTFRQNDLAGPWRVYLQRVESKLQGSTTQVGQLRFDTTGGFSGGDLQDAAGMPTPLSTGSLMVRANGSVTGSLNAGPLTSGLVDRYTVTGTMRAAKDLITGVITAELDGRTTTHRGLVTLVREVAVLELGQAAYGVTEGQPAAVTILRNGNRAGTVTVQYALGGGTAAAADYRASGTGTLIFKPGVGSMTVRITTVQDTVNQGDRTVNLTLVGAGGGAFLGTPSEATLTIGDDDQPGTVSFATPAVSAGETGMASLKLQRTGGNAGGVVVSFRTVDGSARAGIDYTARNSSVTFGPKQTTQTVTVPILPNLLVDGDRTFTVELLSISPAAGVIGSPATAAATIRNDDVGGAVRFLGPASVLEGGAAVLRLVRAGGAGGNVSVEWATTDASARAAGGDYTAASGSVTFGAKEMTKDITVQTLADMAVEGDETFRVTLQNPVGMTLGTPSAAIVTVQDGQQGLQFASAEYTANEATKSVKVTLVRTGPADGVVTVRYSLSPASAMPGADYVPADGLVTFGNKARLASFMVALTADVLAEGPETVLLTLSDPSAPAELGPQRTATLTILDDDTPGVIQLAATAATAQEKARVLTVTVRRVGTAAGVTVDYATTPGTASAGEDYLTTEGTLTFGPKETTKTFTVPILDDSRDEPAETFTVALSNPGGGATLGATPGMVVTIADDDVPGTLAVKTAASMVAETAGVVALLVTRTGGAAGGVTVDYATADGSAGAGEDYGAIAGTLTFNAGEMSKTLAVAITDDQVREGNETFALALSNPGGGAGLGLVRAATVTITDNETGPTVQFGAAGFSVLESAGGATITVTRTGSTEAGESVRVHTVDGGTAPPGDFVAVDQVVTFAARQTSATVAVTVNGNDAIDGDRTVHLGLSDASSPLSLGASRLTVLTIRDDDARLRLASADATVAEGGMARLTVERIGSTAGKATVRYTTTNGSATAPGDYAGRTGVLTLGPGVASQTLAIATKNDTLAEGDETFNLTLSQPTGAALGAPGQATVTVEDNDAAGTVQLDAAAFTVLEGGTASIAVTRTGGDAGPLVVGYATVASGTATGGAARAPGVDYIARSGTLTFAPRAGRQTFTVQTVADADLEGPETLGLQLTVPPGSGAVLGAPSTATLTVLDDEQPRVQFAVAAATVKEAAGGIPLTVLRMGPTSGNHTVTYTLAGVTATAGDDFDAGGGTLVFLPGVKSLTLTVPVVADAASEAAETFTVTLSDPSAGAGLGTPSAVTVTIADDDPAGTAQLAAAGYSVVEGNSVALTVTRTGGGAGPVTVAYGLVPGTALAGADYTNQSGVVTFAAGETSQPIVVGTLFDSLVEGSEFLDLVLGATTGGLVTGPTARARVWILDESQSLQFTAESYAVVEGGTATVTVTRTGIPAGAASATVTLGGTAVAGVDYTDPGPIVLDFPAGVATRAFTIQTLPDAVLEPAGQALTFSLTGLSASVVAGTPAAATLTIMDNERADLVVAAVAGPAQAANGLPLRVTATVFNQAGAPAAASRLGVFLSSGDATPGAGTLLGLLNTPALKPLTAATVTGAVMMPADVAGGAHFLSVVADAPGAVLEASDANNGLTAAAPVDVVRFLPDLVVTGVPAPGTALTGKLVSAPLHVRNAGLVASGPYRVGVFLSQNQSAGTGLLLAVRDMPSLAPGAGADVPLSITPPDDLEQGAYYMVGVADLQDAVTESDEVNNALASPVAFPVTRNLTKLTRVSATFTTASALVSGVATSAAAVACSPALAGQTLDLTGTLSLATQTGTTGQGTIMLGGPVDGGGTVTFRGPFSATVNLDDTVTISFTLKASGAFSGTATATGTGTIADGVLAVNVTDGLLTVTAPPLGSCPFTGTVTVRGEIALFFSLLYFAEGGGFNGQTTPSPVYPLPISEGSVGVAVLFDPEEPADPFDVRFTGPPGSGVTNVPASLRLDVTAGSFYETDTASVAGRTVVGTWRVSYDGRFTRSFAVADPQAEARFIAMLPTVTLDASNRVTAVSWVFVDRRTGAIVPPPPHADSIQVELVGFFAPIRPGDGFGYYPSPDFPRTVTSHTLPAPIAVDELTELYISFKDTLTGNFYVTVYTQ